MRTITLWIFVAGMSWKMRECSSRVIQSPVSSALISLTSYALDPLVANKSLMTRVSIRTKETGVLACTENRRGNWCARGKRAGSVPLMTLSTSRLRSSITTCPDNR